MKKKNVAAVSFDDLKKIVLNDAKNGDGILTQDQIDTYLSTYDLSDDLAEDLLEFIGNNDIIISDDGLDDIDVEDDMLLTGAADDLDIDLDLGDDLLGDDTPDLDFDGDFDMMTSDTLHMYQVADADAEMDQNQLGSNVKINDPVKMYLKEIGRVELLSHDDEIKLAKKIFC